MSESKTFHMQEASFQLPAPFVDRSVQVIEWNDQPEDRLSLTITRQPRDAAKPLAQLVLDSIAEVEQAVGAGEVIGREEGEVAGCEVIQVKHRWAHEQGVVHNHHAFVVLGEQVVIFTAASRPRSAARAAAVIDGVLDSLEVAQ